MFQASKREREKKKPCLAFPLPSCLSALLALFILNSVDFSAAARNDPYESKTLTFIRNSCNVTDYPDLCFSSLSAYQSSIQTSPVQLANAALSVSLTSARGTIATISKLLKGSSSSSVGQREAGAMNDCMENMADSVDELQKSLQEMGELKPKYLKLYVNDMQTWVSSALTDENTCMEGFPSTSSAVAAMGSIRGEIVKAAQLTSNALSLINRLNRV